MLNPCEHHMGTNKKPPRWPALACNGLPLPTDLGTRPAQARPARGIAAARGGNWNGLRHSCCMALLAGWLCRSTWWAGRHGRRCHVNAGAAFGVRPGGVRHPLPANVWPQRFGRDTASGRTFYIWTSLGGNFSASPPHGGPVLSYPDGRSQGSHATHQLDGLH